MTRITGHFGEWLQGRLGPDGPVVLVTLSCKALGVTAEARPSDRFSIDDGGLLGETRARTFLHELGGLPLIQVTLTADMPAGGGAGASTAGLLALAAVAGRTPGEEALATACRRAEGAVDPLMIASPDTCLWASREARALRRFEPLPAFDVVGGFWGAPIRTDADDTLFPDIADLVPMWERAARDADRAALAGIASEAARRTTALRGPEGDPTEDLAREIGALGFVRAHTGSARGLVFAPGQADASVADRLSEAGFQGVVGFHTGGRQ